MRNVYLKNMHRNVFVSAEYLKKWKVSILWYSWWLKRGPRTSGFKITWELVRNANCQAPP